VRRKTNLRATESHQSYGITECYLFCYPRQMKAPRLNNCLNPRQAGRLVFDLPYSGAHY